MELDDQVPGPDLIAALLGLDPAAADLDELTAAAGAWERVLSWATACQNQVLAEADRVLDAAQYGLQCTDAARWYAERLGMALGVTGSSAQRRINTALTLTEKLPEVTAALEVGAVTTHHARLAAGQARVLDGDVARAVDKTVMADPEWRTPSQLEAVFARVVRELDPDGAARRHGQARRDRRVSVRNEPDGMCSLWALLPAEEGQLVHKTLDAHARSSKARSTPGDSRTLDERRADALVELVTSPAGDLDEASGAGPRTHGAAPQIHVTVAMSTLIGADDAPAELSGYGWIDAAVARRIAADPNSVWRRLLVDPRSGRLLDYGRSTYSPPQDLQDFVIARDRTCRFPTCDRPAVGCDLDHRHDWEHGCRTRADCIDPLCRNHHRLKHEAGWHHERDPDTGDSTWTDPTGQQHIKPATRLPTPAPVEPPTAAPDNDPDDPPF